MSRSRPLPQMVVRPLDSGRGRAFRIVLGLAWVATVALAWYLGGRQAAPAFGMTRDALAQVQASSAHLDQELDAARRLGCDGNAILVHMRKPLADKIYVLWRCGNKMRQRGAPFIQQRSERLCGPGQVDCGHGVQWSAPDFLRITSTIFQRRWCNCMAKLLNH